MIGLVVRIDGSLGRHEFGNAGLADNMATRLGY
jgi:hypothetical protein